MKMKLYLASAIIALSWMGCNQEEVVNETKGNAHTICAVIEGTSRSTVTDAGKFSWASGDQISVHDASNKDIYTYSGSGNDFTVQNPTSVSEPVVAYYPANNSHTTSSFFLPSSYGDENTEYVADTHAAMIATPPTDGDTYAFMHLGGVMRFNVKNLPAGTNKFTFTSSEKEITGSFNVTESNGVKIITAQTASQASSVSISFKPLTEKQDMTFYVPLPLGSYGKYKIGIAGNKDNGDTFSFEDTTDNLTEGANTIKRKYLLLMPTYTYDETQEKLVKGEVSSSNTIELEDGDAEATILGNAEVKVTPGNNNPDAVATLNYTPANDESSTLSISDGSAQGTESGESKGKVVVNTTGTTVASCDINAPTLSVTLSVENDAEVTYKEVTALTAQQTLIIGSGVTVQTLKLKGGNVIIKDGATVKTIQNADGFTGKTYIVKEGELTDSPSVNNIIVVSNESELALRIAAENGGDVTLTEDVVLNEPVVIAAGKTVTLNLNGKTISQEKVCTASYSMITNNGNLTITGNGKISFKDTGNGDPSFGWGSYTISNYGGNLTIENGTIEHLGEQNQGNGQPNVHMYCAFFQYSGSTIIKDGKISTPTYRSARLWQGDMTIEGGTFEGQLWVQSVDDSAKLSISGGSFAPNGNDGSSVFIGNVNNNVTYKVDLSITGGTFNTKIGCNDPTQDGVRGKISGGKFTELAKASMEEASNPACALIATGYEFKLNEIDGYYDLKKNKLW